jgi:hypothetical protein
MAKWTGLGDNTELFWVVLSHMDKSKRAMSVEHMHDKNVWNHFTYFVQHQEAKRSVVASFQIFLGTLGNFSIYL